MRTEPRRPHPGAQLSLFDSDEGLRHQVFLTDSPYSGSGSVQFLEVRHRKMTNWHLKHTHHRNPPRPPTPAVTLVPPTKPTSRRQKAT
ncbi:hypothetical protein [Streptomyces sp. NPDC056061]|uniref:hypothetical protein n=1 Tax=Streptomyces sp. NPDC056061 TaxID=3345700 RepID=UPI0035D961FB